MAEEKSRTANGRARRNTLIAALAIVVVGVTVIVLQMIERAPMAGAGGPGGGDPGSGPPPASVFVQPVATEMTQEEAMVTGTLKALSQSDVAARESGAVLEVLVDEGQEVAKGAVLARIDARRLNAQIAEAKARLTSSKSLLEQRGAELERAGTDLEMKRKLRERKAVSESDVLDAERAVNVARAQRNVAEDSIREAGARLELLEAQLADLEVKAPFDGAVVDRRVEPGEWVGAGAVVATMVTMDPVEAWVRVPARHHAGTDSGNGDFRVRQSATGELFQPVKVEKVPRMDPLSQLFYVVATIPNPDRKLTPGESVTGIVPVGRRQAYLKVPVNAVVQTGAGDLVYAVQPPEEEGALPTARRVRVKVAFERDGQAHFPTGSVALQEGDRVVVEGNARLRPGQALMIEPAVEEAGNPVP